ncbi:hypothetical protein ACF0H5_023401 [Mactra antiquata]
MVNQHFSKKMLSNCVGKILLLLVICDIKVSTETSATPTTPALTSLTTTPTTIQVTTSNITTRATTLTTVPSTTSVPSSSSSITSTKSSTTTQSTSTSTTTPPAKTISPNQTSTLPSPSLTPNSSTSSSLSTSISSVTNSTPTLETSTLGSTDSTTTITEPPTPAPSTQRPKVSIPAGLTRSPSVTYKYITFSPDIDNDCRRFDYKLDEEYSICIHKCEGVSCQNGGECAVTVDGRNNIIVGCRCNSDSDHVYSGNTCESSQMSRLKERQITLGILIPIVFLSLLLLICVYAKLRHYG